MVDSGSDVDATGVPDSSTAGDATSDAPATVDSGGTDAEEQ